ncbi:alpha/beta hydrolase [Saccharopolyspora halophila]|uniref:Alpha/beta hydrolase n=1 Tax=Saccharopolyspora halophila TaxID=405551 RepID=A0ABN3GSH5_9PSEU
MNYAEPSLRVLPASTRETGAVVLVLHGGRAQSTDPVRPAQLAYRRMLPFARAAHRAVAVEGAAVWLLCNRVRGWNEPALDAVVDASWALREVERRHPGAGVVLVGHSMGGRAALRLAGSGPVRAVCALAPWTEPRDPVAQLAGRQVLLLHGDRDRVTSAPASAEYARRAARAGAEVEHVVLPGTGHAMLRHAAEWHARTRDFVTAGVRLIAEENEHRSAP